MVQWLHFADVMDKVIVAYLQFSGFYIPKIIKICSFLTELLKIKHIVFLKHSEVRRLTCRSGKAVRIGSSKARTPVDLLWIWSD